MSIFLIYEQLADNPLCQRILMKNNYIYPGITLPGGCSRFRTAGKVFHQEVWG